MTDDEGVSRPRGKFFWGLVALLMLLVSILVSLVWLSNIAFNSSTTNSPTDLEPILKATPSNGLSGQPIVEIDAWTMAVVFLLPIVVLSVLVGGGIAVSRYGKPRRSKID